MAVLLKYNKEGLKVNLPETPGFKGVLEPGEAPAVSDPHNRIKGSLENPIDSPPLAELAGDRKNACIVVSDITRPTPNSVLLPPLLEKLEKSGIERENIIILIATGTHKPNLGEEQIELLGKEIVGNYRIQNHFSRKPEDMVLAGHVGNNIPVHVNRHYFDADLKVLTGLIEPHFWAGYSGGRKSILPGISSIGILEYMHGPEMIAHPMTAYGVLDGNPFHEAGLSAMEKAGADFIVNVTINTKKEITGIFSGHPVNAHIEGCGFISQFCTATLDEPLDFVITTNCGAPLDCNLYQTSKGIAAAAAVVKPGGVILVASSCFEGPGSSEFAQVLDMVDTPDNFLKRLTAGEFFLMDQWCAQDIYQVMLKNPIWLYTDGISEEVVRKYHFTPVSSVENAVEELLDRFGKEARWAVVPEGPMLILKLQDS
ncbi:MAG: nickel-dependent lactate racemase [Planctomycetota bacterium]|nr:MAG: nickel-dependent lactate racemase [Planctomycetota bacterium]